MTNPFPLLWIAVYYSLFITVYSYDLPFGGYYCWLRCTAKCINDTGTSNLNKCQTTCQKYRLDSLCQDEACWLRCDDLVSGINSRPKPPVIQPVALTDDPYLVNVQWSKVDDVTLYVLLSDDPNDPFTKINNFKIASTRNVTLSTKLTFRRPELCSEYEFAVASVSGNGISQFSEVVQIAKASPQFKVNGTMLHVTEVEFQKDKPFYKYGQRYYDNSTRIRLEYDPPINWDISDLSVLPLSKTVVPSNFFNAHISKCLKRYRFSLPAGQIIPLNRTKGKPGFDVITAGLIVDYQCQLALQLEKVASKKCGSVTRLPTENPDPKNPFPPSWTQYKFSCETVRNYDCEVKEEKLYPECTDDLTKELIDETSDGSEGPGNVTAILSWDPENSDFRSFRDSKSKHPILYYAARIGTFDNPGILSVVLLGEELGRYRTCNQSNILYQECQNETDSISVPHLQRNTTYAVQLCAVFDPKYEFLSDVDPRRDTAAAVLLEIPLKPEVHNAGNYTQNLAIGIPLGIAAIVVLCIVVATIWYSCKQRKKMEKMHFEMSKRVEQEDRYTDLPKKHDIWELERRRLIVYEDKRLGAGAFGAVFKGKIIGKVHTLKASESSLATNMMRVENCDVAVKKLPEYADDISKREFMAEISLMKQLGYHENLVNMLACITDSEPYCLVLEFCSDGDLKQFLSERRHYMLKLVENGIDYCNVGPDDSVDIDMVLTMKELLAFAVQISYGLEYMSQKSFIHRDVAARNVMVHNKRYAKIGDFGLCRYTFQDDSAYWGKGGKLPIKWMAPEAINDNHFTTASDVWSFGILLFEIITLGGSPYPGIQPSEMIDLLASGERMAQPDNCPDDLYKVMVECWTDDVNKRPHFDHLRRRLAGELEKNTEEYSYLSLNEERDYYNVPYSERRDDMVTVAEEGGVPQRPMFSLPSFPDLIPQEDTHPPSALSMDSGMDSATPIVSSERNSMNDKFKFNNLPQVDENSPSPSSRDLVVRIEEKLEGCPEERI